MGLGGIVSHYGSDTDGATFTFDNCDFGTEAADRLILVGVVAKWSLHNVAIAGVTINGVAATALVQTNTPGGTTSTPAAWYLLAVPVDAGGANGNVVAVTFSDIAQRAAIAVVRLIGADSTPVDTGACAADGLSDTVDVVAGGYVAAVAMSGAGTGVPTWSNIAESFTATYETVVSAAETDIAADGTLSPSVAWTSSSAPATAIVSFAPSAAAGDEISFSDFDDRQVIQRDPGGTSKTVTIAGSYTGAPTAIEYRIVGDGTDTAIAGHDWQTLDAVPVGGNFSGDVVVPQGGWYNIDLRFAGDTDPKFAGANAWGVGLCVFMIGQSNMEHMRTEISSPPAADSLVSMMPRTTNSWAVPAGNGDIALGNALASALGIPIGLLQYAIGGTRIDSWQTGQSSWTPSAAGLAAAGGDCEFVLWHQGEGDAIDGTAKATYKADLANVYAQCLAATGRSAAELPFLVGLLGLITSPPASTETDASWQAIQDAHLEFCDETAGAYVAGNFIGLAHLNQEHYTGAAYETIAARYAQTILWLLGEASYSGVGPRIAAASISGTTVTVRLAHDGGTDVTPATGITGFEILDDGTPVTISSAVRGAADKIALELASAPSGTVTLRYQYGEGPDISGLVKDNTALALPLIYASDVAVSAPPSSTHHAVQRLAADLAMSL